ncbi:MAG: GNAT family N-acetyltransferase [Polaribacter sp.]|jgi:predicted N-acyltransferase
MTYTSSTSNVEFFGKIEDIPNKIWDDLCCDQNVYLSKEYLSCIEKNHTSVSFSYMILYNSNRRPIAFSIIQIVDFYLDGVNDSIEDFVLRIKKILRKLGVFPDKKPIKLLISGNLFVSGEHGIFIKPKEDKRQVIKQLSKALLGFVSENKNLAKSIDAFMLKDFLDESLFITNELKRFNYHPFSVEPNMELKLNPKWSNFDDYLGAMKTKFRVKAKKALSQSSDLEVKDISAKEIDSYLPDMISLYEKVANSATFNLTHFNLNTYQDLKEKFGEYYFIRCYFLEGKMVGFLSGIENHDYLDAHFVGIDYKYNRTYAIYQRMLYDYIQHGIAKKLKGINFGRTASEIKSSVGAEPENLTIYLRHRKRFTNKLLKLFLFHVQPTPFHQKFPFKNSIHEK